jgi:uncharacterized membrane protein
VARIFFTGNLTYIFLVWNLFLAVIPYVISLYIFRRPVLSRTFLFTLLGIWLLFIPNTFYLLTDLFHLPRIGDVPKWFDLLLLLSFGLNGLLLGIVSLRKIEMSIERISGRTVPVIMVFAVMFLNAFGVYIGRYLRFNSWDIVARPYLLFEELVEIIIHPFDNMMEWGMVCSYSFFMTLIYFLVRKVGENLYND